ncbi:MAG: hypothetical protein ABJL44_08205 [Algibacter sp.]
MVCDDMRCLPPTEVDLVFNLPKKSKAVTDDLESNTSAPKEPKKGFG